MQDELREYAERSGKSMQEVRDLWEQAKVLAFKKKTEKGSPLYWKHVRTAMDSLCPPSPEDPPAVQVSSAKPEDPQSPAAQEAKKGKKGGADE